MDRVKQKKKQKLGVMKLTQHGGVRFGRLKLFRHTTFERVYLTPGSLNVLRCSEEENIRKAMKGLSSSISTEMKLY